MANRPSPRPKIVVVCPECGHRQDEPELVVSTICRRCRSHIEVRDGNAVGPSKSTQGPAFGPPSEQRPPTEQRRAPVPPPPTLRIRQGLVEDTPPPPSVPAPMPPGLRIRTKPSDDTEPPATPPLPVPPTLRIRTGPAVDSPEPPPPTRLPMPPGLRIRTRSPEEDEPANDPPADNPASSGKPARPAKRGLLEKLLRPEPPRRDVLCIDCGRRFQAPAAADTTNCPTCGAYLNLRDFTFAEPSANVRIVTRGNVTITRKGSVAGQLIACHHLAVHGILETGARCSGDLVITSSGLFRGKLRCERLLIQKGARVEFIHPVETGEAIIDGRVTGSVRARLTVTLSKRAKLRGNITASQLILKPGATHHGLLRISAPATETADS